MGHPSAEEIGRLPLFAALSADEHARLAALSTVESFPAGSTIFLEGDPPGDLYVVVEGRVTLCTRIPGQSETCFLSLRPSELLGFSALLGRRRLATARVVAVSKLVRLNASELISLCETEPRVGYTVMRSAFEEIAERLQGTRLQLFDMFARGG